MGGELQEWIDQEWVRIDSSGNIAGPCGTSKNKKNPDRCLPKSKAKSLTKGERAATARKKKVAGSKGKKVVKNTRAAEVKLNEGGFLYRNHKGCGAVMPDRRKKTHYK